MYFPASWSCEYCPWQISKQWRVLVKLTEAIVATERKEEGKAVGVRISAGGGGRNGAAVVRVADGAKEKAERAKKKKKK